MKNKFSLLALVLLTALFSCTLEEEEPVVIVPDSKTTFGIRHDIPLSVYEALASSTAADRPSFAAVIMFDYSLNGSSNSEYVATGTLITPDWILTAGHNFYDAAEQSSPATASGITVKVGNDPNNPDKTYKVTQLVFHPTWLDGKQEYSDGNDLCLVKLSTPITNLTPVPLYTGTDEAIGSKVWYAGFGDYSQLSGQNPDLFSKKHAFENILDRKVGGFNTSFGGTTYNGGLLAFDLDSPDGTINSLGDDFVGADEKLLGPGTSTANILPFEATTVEGDSGGPLFVKKGTTWELAGVLGGGADEPIANHKDGSYGDISIFTRVSPNITWINSVIK
jgi:V8-like Glu-specific endopeptidase